MIDQFINFIIRPPRAEYNPDQFLWEPEFTIAGRKYKRQDQELTNGRGHTLQCSHYTPSVIPEDTALPCVIYCHGNSGCRADANEAAVILLPSNITVFALDFSGSGLSGGDYVSLGWHEKDDLKAVVFYLRNSTQVSCIGLWGRSMGAVTSVLYGAEDPLIACMVLDSAFSNLYNLMMELVVVYKIRLPKFTIKMAIQYMRRVIQKKAHFDIMDLNIVQFAPRSFIPALFGHASEDIFIHPHHTDLVYKSYSGDKHIIKFEGDHNSPRPQFYYDSVSLFFYNVLRPPPISSTPSSKQEKYYNLGALRVNAATDKVDENLLYEIITGLRTAGKDAASSSSAPRGIPQSSGSVAKSVVELISESVANMSVEDEVDFLLNEAAISKTDLVEQVSEDFHPQDTSNVQNDECCSNSSSSNRESWGRCSSLDGVSVRSSSPECLGVSNGKQNAFKALATPLRRFHGKARAKLKEKGKGAVTSNKPKQKGLKLEKTDTLTQRIRHCFLRRGGRHNRHLST